jgi:hypothetical protein
MYGGMGRHRNLDLAVEVVTNMRRIQDLLGNEVPLDSCNRALCAFARGQRPAAVGAVHVTCSDECEREQVESFQQWVADALLPELKFSSRSPFRSANLGGRYEWGAFRIAEEHYAVPETKDSFKLMIVKLNSHVAAVSESGQTVFGSMCRYDMQSACCGALHALLDGTRHPAMDELRMAFSYDEIARLEMLRDEQVVPAEYRSLAVAIVNARLQARSAIVEIQDYVPQTPTMTVVVPTVTINRPQRDSEFVVGMYWTDSRKQLGEAEYIGLGDDPSQYVFRSQHGYLQVRDDQLAQPREARDHRQEVVAQWRARNPQVQTFSDKRFEELARKDGSTSDYSATMARETLTTMLWLAADIAPVPLSILLFTKGLAGVHHLYRVHRLARGADGKEEAQEIIKEVSDQVAKIPAEQARETIDTIMTHYRHVAE